MSGDNLLFALRPSATAPRSGSTPDCKVRGWTGVVVKGVEHEHPLYVTLDAQPGEFGERELTMELGTVTCPCVLRGRLLAGIVPVQDVAAGTHELIITSDRFGPLKLTSTTGASALRVLVVEQDDLQFPESVPWEQEMMAGNSLATMALAEQHHEASSVFDVSHEVAVLVTKTAPTDLATVFVFGCREGRARFDRYETPETNSQAAPNWEYVDSCDLGDVTVNTRGSLTVIQLAPEVEFIFEPRSLKHGYSVNLYIGPIIFAAITPVGEKWLKWFTKKWIPCAALKSENGAASERFAAPTIASVSRREKRQLHTPKAQLA